MDALGPVLLRQERLAHVDQLIAAGYSRAAIRWRVNRGTWQRTLPKVIATFSGILSRKQQLVAAALYGGAEAQIAAMTALELHGFRYAPRDRRVHLLVPTAHSLAMSSRLRIIRTSRPDARAVRNGLLAVCSPARAIVDSFREDSDRRVIRAVLAEALQRGLCSADEVAEELGSVPLDGAGVVRELLEEVREGVRSAHEAELRALAARSPILPRIRWNPLLRAEGGTALPTPDGYLEDAAIAIEIDSREFHLNARSWPTTMRHHDRLTAAGILVLHTTPARIRTEPLAVLAQIESAYVRRVQGGPLPRIQVS
ncbi:hypothetical protein [Hamadaea tsunoensis]|uniref:hypothetical protein n=1 Tax=Hamadaea tsunoensis TaxID=53368 RepID=UPI000687E5A7|nr:hypothetical protein [Hamadaea tsunoensis]